MIGGEVISELADGLGEPRSNRLDRYGVKDVFSFGAAHTEVKGSEGPDGHFNTVAVVTIEDLNVLDILKADLITARLVGLHCEPDFGECPHPWILPLGSTIRNLRIAGQPRTVRYPQGFDFGDQQSPTYEDWKKAKPTYAHPGESFTVPDFGKVTCARVEVIPEPAHPVTKKPRFLHRLTMLSLALGSPVEGNLDFAAIDEDGNPPG